ncbi:uncharacterized protein F4822DRAFT_442920 [Hypoxylon trugodes]|uniref:uncharacterized protein n=1 Tax=Hypoxylon trugodes TaxID=326681 RepID=UPI002196BC02|nr:uncharacterized protein F4822DRAFT_442920 [Hypoxylon trugodes]KAI1389727.1 hypothetical protein F4822DRAFT_442920 [Hypoxylon trugodes]
MTSLQYIMDVDDEESTPHINKDDGGSINPGPSRSQDPSRAATSSHEKSKDQDDRLTPAPTRRRGPSGRSSKSTAAASSSSSSTPAAATTTVSSSSSSARPALMSRRSTTSSESMDPYGSHAQGSSSGGGMSSSGMPSRPIGNSPGDGTLPVKLTPITGRVSRAKKGMPVHVCETRHQLSHKTPGFPCTFGGCDKSFHRADLLARHAQRHEQGDGSSRGTGGGVSRPTSAGSLGEGASGMSYLPHNPSPMSGGAGSRSGMTGQSEMSSGTSYPSNLPPYQQMGGSSSTSGQTPMSPSQHGESYQSGSNPPTQGQSYVLSNQMPIMTNPTSSIGGSPVTGTSFGPMDYQPRTSSPSYSYLMDTSGAYSQNLPSLTIPDSIPPGLVPAGHDGSPWPSSASATESTYSTPSDMEINRRGGLAGGYGSPASDWHGGLYSSASHNIQSPDVGLDPLPTSASFYATQFSPTAAPNLDQGLGLPMFSDEQSFVEHSQQYHPYSSVRSPTPPTISLSAQSAETLVTLTAPTISDAASAGGRQKGSTVLLGPLQGTAFLTVNSLSPHVRNAIPKYLDLYWKRFDTLVPLVHHKSIKTAADGVLRCAMAAVGTQFLQGKDDRIRGNELHEFAWKEVKTCTQWNLEIMQAIILCEFYSRFRGRSAQRSSSEPFQSLYSRVSLQPHFYSSSPHSCWLSHILYFQDHLFSSVLSSSTRQSYQYSTYSSLQMADHYQHKPDAFTFTSSTRNESWNEWIEHESRRRLLAACFVLDIHTSVYYQQHFLLPFPMSIPPVPLIKPTEDLWDAQTPEAWKLAMERMANNTEPLSLSDELPTAEQTANAPPLDNAVILTAEALRLPRRSSPSILDLTAEVDLTCTERISKLFQGSGAGNTYLALHYTPLHDLLAVSGETWLFSKKIQSPDVFEQHRRRLQKWCGSLHAGAAVGFAAKALIAYLSNLNHTNDNILNTAISPSDPEEEDGGQGRDRSWNMMDLSDYWAVYVCALICWAHGHRTIRGSSGSGPGSDHTSSTPSHHHNRRHSNVNTGDKGEREAMNWLKMVSDLSPEKALKAQGRKETMTIVSMIRRRLEDEAVGGKSRLLVDAMWTLKKLEERANHKWF